jgi:Tol biopolymer transport system component
MEASLLGQTLGAYRIIEQIGRGGMATVYKAYEPALDRYVAIKVLPQYFAHDPDFSARFEREAKAVAKLNHPNILPIYSFGQEAGWTYIAMHYVEAGTLKEMLGQPLDLKTTANIFGQIGKALDYAHRRGVVHRDVKPANVLMAEGNWALLTDFGLARMVEASVQLTKTGVGVGTPAYMSPEQGQGIKVDARTDIYSLGVVLYEMVTGRVPYEAETPLAVVLKHISAPLPLPRTVRPDLPEAVERVILKALAKAPDGRYQTAEEMVEALEQAVAGAPVEETLAAMMEPSPAAAAVPVAAPPVAKRGLPGWVWGVAGVVIVLLLVAGAIFFATQGMKPAPAPTGTAASAAALPTPAPAQPAGKVVDRCEGAVPPQICVRDAETGQVTQVTDSLEFGVIGRLAWSPDGRQIVFDAGSDPEATHQYNHKLYIINADGSGLRQVTSGDTNDIDPAWSPDGQWIVFHRNGSLTIMRPDGPEAHDIYLGADQRCADAPVWTPDSQRIAFVISNCGADKPYEVWTINRDGSGAAKLVSAEVDWQVVWSPDGRQIAYSSEERWYLVSSDGSGQPQEVKESEIPRSWQPDFWPPWGGEKEAAAQPARSKVVERCEGVKPPQICVHDAETGQITQVTKDLEFESIDRAAWSPDGQQIVFDGGSDADHKLYIVNADGSGLKQITGGDLNSLRPAWSPDGQWIAFHGSCGLWLVRPDGSDAQQLLKGTPGKLCAEVIGWSPDGQQIAFASTYNPGVEKAPFDVWVVNRDGSDPRKVYAFERPLKWVATAWSPDGRQIACWYEEDNMVKALLLNADGSGQPQEVKESEIPWSWQPDFWPPWGGEKEAAAQPAGKVAERCEDLTPHQICVRDAETGQITQVTKDLGFGDVEPRCAWSPDGQQIFFTAGSGPGAIDHKLYIVNADGSGLRQITTGETNDLDPVLSPGGDWIAFHRNCDLWLIRLDGSDARRLLEGSPSFCAIMMSWSPDSQRIAFANLPPLSDKPTPPEMWVVNRDGSESRVVYTFPRPLEWVDVAWSPDGRQIAGLYNDDDREKVLLTNADGSGEPQTIEKESEMPRSWYPNFWPPWGGVK